MTHRDLSLGVIGTIGVVVSLAIAVGLETLLKGVVAIGVAVGVLGIVAAWVSSRER